MAGNYYIKTNRTFSLLRKNAWVFTLLVAIGGLWQPKLGLLVILIMAGLMITAFFTGRFWCGNICPHGSLFDRLILPGSRNIKIPALLRSKIFIIGFFIFFMFNFTRKILNAFHAWGNFDFWDRLGFVFVGTYLVVLIIGGVVGLIFTPRTWCQFCPMGSIQKATHGLGRVTKVAAKTESKITIESHEKCHQCGKCARVCPFQLAPYLDFSENKQLEDINCIKCGTCVENCPAGILSLEKGKEAYRLGKEAPLDGFYEKQKIRAQIIDIKELNEDVREYVFSFVSPQRIKYKSGQFILLKVQDDPVTFRAYTISSYYGDGKSLRVIIKREKNGYGTGKIFSTFKIGDPVELEGPMGNELLLNPQVKKALFVSNGIGTTPFIPLTRDILENYSAVEEVVFLVGQRYEKDFIYHDYFNQYADKDKRFKYIPVVSRDVASDYPKGYVTDIIRDMDLEGFQVYMCGTKKMITDSKSLLLSKGVSEADIYAQGE